MTGESLSGNQANGAKISGTDDAQTSTAPDPQRAPQEGADMPQAERDSTPTDPVGQVQSNTPRDKRFTNHKFTLIPKPWYRERNLVDLSWSVLCRDGAVSLNCGSYLDSNKIVEWSCGMEFHRRVPVDNSGPTFAKCYLLDGFCWHEGSSSLASDFWYNEGGLRFYQSGDHAYIFSHLEYELSRFFHLAGSTPEACS